MGLPQLIEALSLLRRRGQDFFCVIGGRGTVQSTLKRSIAEHDLLGKVRLEGFIPEEALPDYYRAADITLLPSVELEGFGLIILEAFASGCPVVGTPVGNIPALLGPITPKSLACDTTPESFAAAIEATLQTAGQDVRIGVRAHVERNFSWSTIAQRIDDDLLGGYARRARPSAAFACEV
jgi:glycosyltransferase involved in cell wall biosynthesis